MVARAQLQLQLQKRQLAPNWSIYLKADESGHDPESQALWGTNIRAPNFITAWSKQAFVDNNSFFSDISQADWADGINTLKSASFRGKLPTIISYTCYDRNKKDKI